MKHTTANQKGCDLMTKKMMNMMALSAIFALTVTGCNAANTTSTTIATNSVSEQSTEQVAASESETTRTHETITFDIPSADSNTRR